MKSLLLFLALFVVFAVSFVSEEDEGYDWPEIFKRLKTAGFKDVYLKYYENNIHEGLDYLEAVKQGKNVTKRNFPMEHIQWLKKLPDDQRYIYDSVMDREEERISQRVLERLRKNLIEE